MKTRSWMPFFVCIALSLAAGGIGAAFTLPSIPTWYAALNHPSWTPPNWVFGPVWNTLYVLMGIAAGLVWKNGTKGKYVVLTIFFLHLVLNAAWSIVFFGLHDVFAALIIIKLLWLSIALLMYLFWRHAKAATYLLIPYLMWVTYASSLNFGILLLNP